MTCRRNGDSLGGQLLSIALKPWGKITSWEHAVKKLIHLGAAAALVLGIAGCASQPTQVASTGNLLTKAGFQARPADSPHRISEMMKMTPHKFVTRVRNGQLVYLYPDPMVCECVYYGSQQNWDAYRRELEAEQIVKALSSSDVMLFVRAPISSRRSSAIAGIACGLPVIAYSGNETAPPITDAGVVLVSPGNNANLGEALLRVLSDADFRESLAARSRQAQREHFSWAAIAKRYAEVLSREE